MSVVVAIVVVLVRVTIDAVVLLVLIIGKDVVVAVVVMLMLDSIEILLVKVIGIIIGMLHPISNRGGRSWMRVILLIEVAAVDAVAIIRMLQSIATWGRRCCVMRIVFIAIISLIHSVNIIGGG